MNSRNSLACYQPPPQARQQPGTRVRKRALASQTVMAHRPMRTPEHSSRLGGPMRTNTHRRFTFTHACRHSTSFVRLKHFLYNFSSPLSFTLANMPFCDWVRRQVTSEPESSSTAFFIHYGRTFWLIHSDISCGGKLSQPNANHLQPIVYSHYMLNC